jgi:hypothetical protein
MRRFTTLITETPGVHALYARLGGDIRESIDIGMTLTIRLWSIRLDCDAAQVEYVHTVKKLSIILKKTYGWSKVSAKYAPPSQIARELGTESYFQNPDLCRSLNNSLH